MPPIASNYRPNAARSINVIGEFDEPMAADVLPEILRLRQESNDPITVFIHSRGGFITTMEAIDSALQTMDFDGNAPKIITVAVGDVSSAAANLLAFGDYSIVYPDSNILFHGIRVGEVQVTVEGAQNMAGRLASLNRKVSQRVAKQILPRIMFRLVQIKPQLIKKQKNGELKSEDLIQHFTDAISFKVGGTAKRLIQKCSTRVSAAASLSESIIQKIKFSKNANPKKDDPKVLRSVLKHEIENSKSADWMLDESGMQRLVEDYFLLRGFHQAQSHEMYFQAIQIYGPEFLNETDRAYFNKTKSEDDKKAMVFLFGKTSPFIAHLWFYTVTLSHNLYVGENQISARDAYWLGLIDEISGKDLPCERLVMEPKREESIKEPSAKLTTAEHKAAQTSGA
jgi:ATP-dependent protease ClpP protease subunit